MAIKKILKNIYHALQGCKQKIYIKIFYPGIVLRSPITFWAYIFPQKILNINGSRKCPWPVHYTSFVGDAHNIKIL